MEPRGILDLQTAVPNLTLNIIDKQSNCLLEWGVSKNNNPIYLDAFATTPLAPEAKAAMLNAWTNPANAGSAHFFGELAQDSVSKARAAVADLIGAAASEIVFTSGATEANNIALIGIARWALETQSYRRRIVVSAIEHKAVLEPALWLRTLGFEVIFAPVDSSGGVDCEALDKIVDEQTLLVSVMTANNETGAIQPLNDVVSICRKNGALIHSDGAQAVGKVSLDVLDLDIDYLSLSSHKMYGPVGIGALYVSAAAPKPKSLCFGGGQEGGIRPGTQPVPLIVGFGAAAEIAHERLLLDEEHGRQLSQRLLHKLQTQLAECRQITSQAPVLPGSLCLLLPGIEANDLIDSLRGVVCFSTGSACSSGQLTASHVLSAMGLSKTDSTSVFRIFCNRYNTIEQIDLSASLILEACQRVSGRTGRVLQ